jgi:dihydroorotate dehydrogenase
MYRLIIRPLLFLIYPETVHNLIVLLVKTTFFIPGVQKLVSLFFSVNSGKLKTEFAGLTFPNPVGLAAGFDKKADFFNEFSAFGFAFIEIGTVTPLPQPGNPKPRSFRLKKDGALINRMGFNSEGVKKVVENLKKNRKQVIVGGNIGKNTLTLNENALSDYEICFRELYDYVDYFVVNVSCPNILSLAELQDARSLEKILLRLVSIRTEQKKYKPVLLKISPDLSFQEIDDILKIYNSSGIDGIVATNTTTGRNDLITEEETIQSIGRGGLSGKPLAKKSTEIIRYISQKSGNRIPVIGVGGIMTPEDAIEKLEAGATLVQVYTGFIYEGPCIVKRINKAILKRNNNSLL